MPTGALFIFTWRCDIDHAVGDHRTLVKLPGTDRPPRPRPDERQHRQHAAPAGVRAFAQRRLAIARYPDSVEVAVGAMQIASETSRATDTTTIREVRTALPTATPTGRPPEAK